MAFGLTTEGFTQKDLDTILREIEVEQRANINPALNQTADSVFGQVNAIVATKLRELWELAEAVYKSKDPDDATGQALDAVAAITGTVRNAADKTQVTAVTVNLDASTTLPAGSVAHILGDTTARFVTKTDVTSTTAGNYSVDMEAESAGVVPALAGTLTVIAQPVTGWNSVTNPTDGDTGSAVDTDPALRTRREAELAGIGGTSVDGIRANILQVDQVDYVAVFENTSEITDPEARPPHSIEAVVEGGLDDDIAQAIWDAKSGGILSHSDTADSGTATDSEGNAQTVGFTRTTSKTVYQDIEVVTDPGTYAGDDAVKAALAAYGITLNIGGDVIHNQGICAALDVAGVLDINFLKQDFFPAPVTEANLVVGSRERAVISTANITVTAV